MHLNALIDIYERSVETFGIYQAEAYQAGLKHTFELLASFPEIGRFAQEYRLGYRRYRYEKHSIFYTIEPDRILIRHLIHTARDIRPELFD